ncbi:hypothetical protein WJX81_001294 [Elliptochloris bilobata]|uniref:ubiquitinyl hydrolase 1 n=1 Tax=Elliptochloris bilobata TaxID=381761 RepID=A0AAW1SJI9_9CHLO
MAAGSPAPAQSSHSGVSAQRGSTCSAEQVESIAANVPSHSGSCYGDAVVDIVALSPAVQNAEVSSRPTDEEIIAQENAIRASEAEKLGFVGDIEPLVALEKEYEAGSEVFVRKIRSLESSYRSMRRTRGDGNCFFRSFIFAYMEVLVATNDLAERNRVVTCLRQWRPKLMETGFQELVFEDALEVLIDQLNSLGTAEPLTVRQLEDNLRDASLSPMIVMMLRMLDSAEIQRRGDFFYPFILGMSDEATTVEQFCRRYVEPMGEESDHVHIVALTDALQVPIRVVYLDRTAMPGEGGSSAVATYDFTPAGCAGTPPRVHLLYRPGHYDVLYPALPAPPSVPAAST